jgi:[acyl-carrier-protein] S-malonyltransferase
MKPAAERLREKLQSVTLTVPRIPVVNNIDAAVQTDPQALRDALYRQAFGPVRWVEVVQALRARGLTHVLECGPGKVLSGLVKRVDADAVSMTVFDPATLAEARELLA